MAFVAEPASFSLDIDSDYTSCGSSSDFDDATSFVSASSAMSSLVQRELPLCGTPARCEHVLRAVNAFRSVAGPGGKGRHLPDRDDALAGLEAAQLLHAGDLPHTTTAQVPGKRLRGATAEVRRLPAICARGDAVVGPGRRAPWPRAPSPLLPPLGPSHADLA